MKINFSTFLSILLAGMVLLLVGKQWYLRPKFVNGETAPDFSARLTDGSTLRLSDLYGQYVLLDFWGSWCGPCRAQNPGWAALNRKYHGVKLADGSGFSIISVAIEKDAGNWQKAMQQDGLTWPNQVLDQTSSLRFFNSPIASLYKVKQLPTSYLINPLGLIVGVNMEPEAVDKFLAKKLQ